jgi:metal-sulfur cluster biosynthetic enzyme
MTTALLPSAAEAEQALRSVIDPEIGINIVDLGLVYAIELENRQISVTMTMTTPACPMGSMLQDEALAALQEILPIDWHATVNLVFEPEWTPQRMSEAARTQLGW